MGLFHDKFNILIEADGVQEQPKTDREAMAQQLDTAKPEDFDTNHTPAQVERQKQVDQVKISQIQQLQEWISEVDKFVEYLNGTNDNSIQTRLHAAPCETVFEDIARSEKKKIARLAAELSTLSESLKGYLISFND